MTSRIPPRRQSRRTARHRAWLFRPRGRRLDRRLCQPQLRPRLRDDPAAVAENRARVVAALAPGSRAWSPWRRSTAPSSMSSDADWDIGAAPEGDGMATAMPGMALGILTADCAPVLFADAEARRDRRRPCRLERRAGRRAGSHHRGHGKTGRPARRASPPPSAPASPRPITKWARISATASWRTIRQRALFRARGQAGHFRFDLAGYVAAQAGAGRASATSRDLALCTYPPENGFFSFRRTTHRGEADYGREISAIVLDRVTATSVRCARRCRDRYKPVIKASYGRGARA